jgi:hypothetical protein
MSSKSIYTLSKLYQQNEHATICHLKSLNEKKRPRHNYGVWNPVLCLGQALEGGRFKQVNIRIVH